MAKKKEVAVNWETMTQIADGVPTKPLATDKELEQEKKKEEKK